MGFFSFLTSDSGESIRNCYTEEGARTVYLLQPNGKPPIEETSYQGYGEFGGVDAYEWLARNNLPKKGLKGLSSDEVRSMGIALGLSEYYLDKDDGSKWHYSRMREEYGIKPFTDDQGLGGTYETPQSKYGGKTPNELIASGQWESHKMAELMIPEGSEYRPLKFSYDKNAVYEDLPASSDDPSQGFFDLGGHDDET